MSFTLSNFDFSLSEQTSICLMICFLIFSDTGTGSLLSFLQDLKTFFLLMYCYGFLIISSIYSSHLIRILKIYGLLHLKLRVLSSYVENLGMLSLNFLPIRYFTLECYSPLVNISTIFLLKLGYSFSTSFIRVLNIILISLIYCMSLSSAT